MGEFFCSEARKRNAWRIRHSTDRICQNYVKLNTKENNGNDSKDIQP